MACPLLSHPPSSPSSPSPPSAQASCFYFFLDDVSADQPSSRSVMTICISPGLTLVNLLPLPLRYAWRENGGRPGNPTEVGTIDKGEERAAPKVAPPASGLDVSAHPKARFHRKYHPSLTALGPLLVVRRCA